MITATNAKQAIRTWAQGYHAVEEWALDFQSRVDLLLIPVGGSASVMETNRTDSGDYMGFWERCGLVGVEVKVSRSDFLRGLKEGQFTRYAEALAGLYVAVPHGYAKPREIPEGLGVLTLVERGGMVVCACRRHPRFNQVRPDGETAWRLLFRLREEMIAEMRRNRERQIRWESDVRRKYGQKVAREVARALLRGGVE